MVLRFNVDARRIAALVAVLAITLGLLTTSAFGAFRGATTVVHSANSGVMALTLADGDAAQALNGQGINVYPGSTNQRLVNLTIGGSVNFKTLTLVTTLCPSACVGSELNTDTVNGVQMKIERCTQAWTFSSGSAPDKTYTCGGTTELVQSDYPILNTKSLTVDPNDSLLTVGSVNYYRFTFSLPTTALNSMQGDLSGITFTFNGTQRDAINK